MDFETFSGTQEMSFLDQNVLPKSLFSWLILGEILVKIFWETENLWCKQKTKTYGKDSGVLVGTPCGYKQRCKQLMGTTSTPGGLS